MYESVVSNVVPHYVVSQRRFSANTWVHTSNGPSTIQRLPEGVVRLIMNGTYVETDERGFEVASVERALVLKTEEGYRLHIASDTVFQSHDGRTGRRITEMKKGDLLLLTRHRYQILDQLRRPDTILGAPMYWGADNFQKASYLSGLLIGTSEGYFFHRNKVSDDSRTRVRLVSAGWSADTQRDEPPWNLYKPAILHIDPDAGYDYREKKNFGDPNAVSFVEFFISETLEKELLQCRLSEYTCETMSNIERWGMLAYLHFLRGFFEGGRVTEEGPERVSALLVRCSLTIARSIQRMLLRLGILSTIRVSDHPVRQWKNVEGPDWGKRPLLVEKTHEIVVSGSSLFRFIAIARLRHRAERSDFRVTEYATLSEIVDSGNSVEEMYRVRLKIPSLIDANGFAVHSF